MTSLPLAPDFAKPAGLRKGASFYPELESLRGVAILLVVAFHGYAVFFGALKAPISPQLSLALVQGGHTGVSCFLFSAHFYWECLLLRRRSRIPVDPM